ncbi:MAG TPA: SHOCT domain-containing protein [Solirubrobacterales bacterium]|nr:SHOCT domain-containing protein [Solirubrobacterales bacterium]
MRYFLRTVIGLGLLCGSITAISYGVFQLLQVGTCASGGPYVVARECPEGTEAVALAIPIGIFVMLGGAGLYAVRGAPPGSEKRGDPALSFLILWSGLFLGIGFACFWGVWGPNANPGPGGELGGLIVGFLFIPMGVIPLFALAGAKKGKEKVSARLKLAEAMQVQPARPKSSPDRFERPTRASSGTLSELERLQRLREQGAIDDAEFARLKAEVMGS